MKDIRSDVDEIASGIYRISTFVPGVTPEGFTFNQFLLAADEPLLFHTGPRAMFPLVAEAVATVLPVETVRWISFGHVEADECGAMNMWLAAAPRSRVAFNALGCDVSLNDLSDRPPRVLAEGEVLDLGGKRVRQVSTPHVPHGWEAQVLFEETTGTLLCGDLFTQVGRGPALATGSVVERALQAEGMFHATALAPHTVQTLRSLGELNPGTLAIMHGPSFEGNGRRALHDLAEGYERLLVEATGSGAGVGLAHR
jgi:flavorubredoxin